MADQSRCKSCYAAILWVEMAASGKKNPLDAKPDALHGNITVTENGKGIVLKGEALEAARRDGMDLYISHFASCPNRLQHRKPR